MQIPFPSAESSSNPFQMPLVSTPFLEKPGPLPGLHLPEKYAAGGRLSSSQPGIMTARTSFFPSLTPLSTQKSTGASPECTLATSIQTSATSSSASGVYLSHRIPGSPSSSFFPNPDRLVVLIADDNGVNVRILEHRVKKMGHLVFVSRDGQECYEKFVENHRSLDFLLMDIDVSRNLQVKRNETIRI
jgi:hypothetical protein